MTNIYQENILEHYYNPRNRREIKKPHVYYRETNPLCGDEIAIFAKLKKGVIVDVSFLARGCAISQASASMLTEAVMNKTLSYAMKMSGKDVMSLLNIPISPSRTKCALLALKALQAGIVVFNKNGKNA